MKLGNFKKIFFCFFFILANTFFVFADDKIETVPLINLEELSPTFEEDKDVLESTEEKNIILNESKTISKESKSLEDDKVYVNLEALDKITAKTSSMIIAVGDKKIFGSLEIKALKCQLSKDNSDAVAYIQVKDLSATDNDRVFLFNGWTFSSSPTLQSIDHPIYDLWITSCENT